jgi:hypothetical protein
MLPEKTAIELTSVGTYQISPDVPGRSEANQVTRNDATGTTHPIAIQTDARAHDDWSVGRTWPSSMAFIRSSWSHCRLRWVFRIAKLEVTVVRAIPRITATATISGTFAAAKR